MPDNVRGNLPMISRVLAGLGLRRGPGALLLALLLAVDAVGIVLHITSRTIGVPDSPYYSISADAGHGEYLQYMKMFSLALLLVLLWWTQRRGFWLAAALVAVYIGGDDAFELHERGGELVAIGLPAPWEHLELYVRELAFMAVVGLVLLGLLAVSYRRAGVETRRAERHLILLFLAFALFAVGVDALQGLHPAPWYFESLGVIEDGGEMVTTSVLLAFAFAHVCAVRGFVPTDAVTPSAAPRPPSDRPGGDATGGQDQGGLAEGLGDPFARREMPFPARSAG